jgi:gluconokinase
MIRAMVVMGVTGSGKSTLARALAQALGWRFVEGDSLHPAANIAKMAAGQALNDEDRRPFLDNVARAMADSHDPGIVVSCSALKRSYRDQIRHGQPQVLFVLPRLTRTALQARLSGRAGHFMPASLLDSQLAILEMPQPDELAIQVEGEATTEEQVRQTIAAAQAVEVGLAVRIQNVDPQGEVALALLREAAFEVRPLYCGDAAAALPLPRNAPLGPREIYIVAWLAAVPVGCGAIRELNQASAELRRMYVHREYRRRHIGRTMLLHLQNEARRLGYSRLLLETGDRQAPAMALYEAAGFSRVPPFGRYADDPTSVCYELDLQS